MIGEEQAIGIERIVSAAITRQAIPGLAILVAQNRRIVFARGYGSRNLGADLPVDEQTSFRIASISKQFTAAAIMRLQERGRLAIDDRIGRYLPWLGYATDIPIVHLMNHTSGIVGYTELDDFDLRCFKAATPREIVETVLQREPAFAPGDDWQYSNTNYMILGAILEAVAEKSYGDIVEDELLGRVNTSSTVVDDSSSLHSNSALGYTSLWLGAWESARELHPSWAFGTAGLQSNVLDIFTWNVALRSGRVVTAPSFQVMQTATLLNDGRRVNYGFGLQTQQTSIGRSIHHDGSLPGFSLDNTVFLDREIDIIVLTNGESTNTRYSITLPVAALLTAEPHLYSVDGDTDGSLGRDIPEPKGVLELMNAFVTGGLDVDLITDRFRRFLTPARYARSLKLSQGGLVRALHRVQSYRRDPVSIHAYRADRDRDTLRAQIIFRDRRGIDDIALSRWDRS